MFKRGFSAWTTAFLSVSIAGYLSSPLVAQPLPNIEPELIPSLEELTNGNKKKQVGTACILLDGRCLFRVAGPKSDLSKRVESTQTKLEQISSIYFKNPEERLKLEDIEESEILQGKEQKIHNIYMAVGDQRVRLMIVTEDDARILNVDIATRANQIIEQLKKGLEQANKEREANSLVKQGRIAAATLASMFLVNLAIAGFKRSLVELKEQEGNGDASDYEQVWKQLVRKQQLDLRAVQHLFLQLAQVIVWVGGSLFIIGLFPYTRAIQLFIVTGFRIPLRIGIAALATYVIIRLSYALIGKFNSVIASHSIITAESNQRLQLRLATISRVTRGIVSISVVGIGFLVALTSVGVNIAPLLAGAGIIGLAISFASQNLIKDAINGFFIILEDQYAVGDVISVGDMAGLVENMNLRITQLRDAEGRLITIPNSEIRIVANFSSTWSRADLNIPIAYHSDVDKAIELVGRVADEMCNDQNWKEQILDSPEVLGVESFDERGVIIKVWIKTQPLKQWDVSREFRRRVKIACDRAGIPILPPQQQVWFKRHS